jgi:hypothetical protein
MLQSQFTVGKQLENACRVIDCIHVPLKLLSR